MTWAATTTAPGWAQTSTTGPGANMTIAPQAATSSGASGSLVVNVAAPGSGATEAGIQFQRGGTGLLTIQAQVGLPGTGAIYGGGVTPSSSNYGFYCAAAGNNTGLNSTSLLGLNVNGSGILTMSATQVVVGVNNIDWAAAATPLLNQLAQGSTSAGSGAAGGQMTLTAQAGQAATGASNQGGAGGSLVLVAGIGGSSGSSTPGVGGTCFIRGGAKGGTGALDGGVQLQTGAGVTVCSFGVGGSGFGPNSSSISTATGTISISTAQLLTPLIYFTATLSGGITIDFGGTSGGVYWLDFSQATLGGNSVTVKNGSKSVVVTSLLATPKTLLTVTLPTTNMIGVG
jgi:hypothetical protein